MEQTSYLKYRGKCKEFSEQLVNKNPKNLRLVRGYYWCPFWGMQQHWWVEDKKGKIIDPTKDQFPSRGNGEYKEFDGNIVCSNCGKTTTEERADIHGRYAFCSYSCYGQFVL